MTVYLQCDGVVENFGGSATCSTNFVQVNEIGVAVGLHSLDVELMAAYVGAGFFTLLPLWGAIISGRALLRAISP